MVTYTAKNLRNIAEQFKAKAERAQAISDGTVGYHSVADRRSASHVAAVWWEAATILFNTTLEDEANGQQS